MADTKELKQIKKLYGERTMQLCRRLFPTLLETEGLLLQVLTSTFATNSRTLGEDITEELEDDFKYYIYSKVDVEKTRPEIIVKKSPEELLAEAGYDLYECTSEEKIQSFKKYYKAGEELCTFHGGRLDRCVVFWAVKRNASELKREDFEHPRREDEYGTSVMSIQFSRGQTSTVSIKNRYNHTVNNPDATYGNDLDRIIPGLTQSFAELLAQRGMQLNGNNIEDIDLPGYVVGPDGKYYKYNMEINGIYYCPGNIIIDHDVISLDSEKKILFDYFILDRETGKIELYDSNIKDCFTDGLEESKRIEVVLERDEDGNKTGNRVIKMYKGSGTIIEIKLNRNNEIIGYKNDELEKVGDCFLDRNHSLTELSLSSLTEIGNRFILNNKVLAKLSLPSLTVTGDDFLLTNIGLTQLSLPNLKENGNGFLFFNEGLMELSLPKLKKPGKNFLHSNKGLGIDFKRKSEDQIMQILIGKNIVQKQVDLEESIVAKSTAEIDKTSERKKIIKSRLQRSKLIVYMNELAKFSKDKNEESEFSKSVQKFRKISDLDKKDGFEDCIEDDTIKKSDILQVHGFINEADNLEINNLSIGDE